MIELELHDWNLGARRKMPVNETVLQEMVDFFFRRNESYLEMDQDQLRRKIRHWQGRLTAPGLPPTPAVPPVEAPAPVAVVPMSWPRFLSAQRQAGKSAAEAAQAWNAQKATG